MRQSSSQRPSDTADRKRAGSEGGIVVRAESFALRKETCTDFSRGMDRELGQKWDRIKFRSIELCHWIGLHITGSYTIPSDHTRVKPVGVDRPTRFKNRFLVSWSLFALRVFLERTIRCVVRRNFCPNSAGFYSGACSILCRPDDQVLCTTHQTRNSSVLFSSCQTSHARVAKVKQKKLPQNCIDKLKLFCNRRSGESQAGLLFFSQSLNAQMKEHGSREIPFAVKLRWKFFS